MRLSSSSALPLRTLPGADDRHTGSLEWARVAGSYDELTRLGFSSQSFLEGDSIADRFMLVLELVPAHVGEEEVVSSQEIDVGNRQSMPVFRQDTPLTTTVEPTRPVCISRRCLSPHPPAQRMRRNSAHIPTNLKHLSYQHHFLVPARWV